MLHSRKVRVMQGVTAKQKKVFEGLQGPLDFTSATADDIFALHLDIRPATLHSEQLF